MVVVTPPLSHGGPALESGCSEVVTLRLHPPGREESF